MARSGKRSTGRKVARVGAVAGVALAVAGAAWALREVPAAVGATPARIRRGRAADSPQYRDGTFQNRVTTVISPSGMANGRTLRELLFGGKDRKPAGPIPTLPAPTPAEPGTAADGLHVTWYGHASALVEIDGARVLVDPVWGERCSPVPFAGPRRLHQPPVAVDELPALDAVIISHDHYDHLDLPTVRALTELQSAPFVVPLGVGAHLAKWGVPAVRIIELDWDEHVTIAGIRLTVTPARHFSGRRLARNYTLWGSWVLAGARHRLFYTGDSGYFEGYAEIGERYGPFDAALVQIGAYDVSWPDIHMTPEEAIAAHLDVQGGLLIPVHWGTFVLAFHPWGEPVDRLWREAKARDVRLAVPRPGERVDVSDPPAVSGWWQALGS